MSEHYVERLCYTPLDDQGSVVGGRWWFTISGTPDPDVPWGVIAAPTGSQMQLSWPEANQTQPEQLSMARKEHSVLVAAGATLYSWLRLKNEELTQSETSSSGISGEDAMKVMKEIQAIEKGKPYQDFRLRRIVDEMNPADVAEPFNKTWIDEDGDLTIKVTTAPTHEIYSAEQWTELKTALAAKSTGKRYKFSKETTASDNAFVRAMPHVVDTLSALRLPISETAASSAPQTEGTVAPSSS